MKPGPAPSFWTPARVAELTRLWDEAKTNPEIIAAMGLKSRHQLGAKVHKLGLKRPDGYAHQMPTPAWPPERKAELQRLWLAGNTTPAIAKLLKDTRTAVEGQISRQGLRAMRREIVGKPLKAPAVARAPKVNSGLNAHPARKALPMPAPANEVSVTALPLLELEHRHCRWPISGEGEETLFCAAAKPFGDSYCLAHAARAYNKPLSPRIKPPFSAVGRARAA